MTVLAQMPDGTFVEVHRGSHHLVQRVLGPDGSSLIIKQQVPSVAPATGADPLRAEYEVLQHLAAAGVPHVAQAVDLIERDGRPMLVLKDAGPHTLAAWLRRRPLPIDNFLDLAIQLTEIVASVHRQRVFHRDVNPNNVVLNAEADRLTLIDFGHATIGAGQERDRVREMAGTPDYIAPEQTGQIERKPDHRADLYSLGATLYEVLTGSPPFSFENRAALIHAHLALAPLAPAARNPAVPEVLSSVVLRLLAKMPEERYQSADALLADLCESQRQWKATGTIAPVDFVGQLGQLGSWLGPRDPRLFGREGQLAALEAAVDRTRAGACELVFIGGAAGIGKSSVVSALARRVAAGADGKHYFLSGKCELMGANLPYAPLVQALRGFFAEFSRRPGVDLDAWRTQLTGAIGPSASVIADWIPELGGLLGTRAPVAEAGALASAARTRRAFELTLSALADWAGEHGQALIVHIDDLHWADRDSLALLERIGRGAGGQHLLLLGSFRSDEVGDDHPIRALLAPHPELGIARSHIELGPLSLEALVALCANLTGRPAQDALPLARLILRKTGGNPFFALRFVQRLQSTGQLRSDPAQGSWHWDLEALEATSVTDNVADLLIDAFAELPAPTRAVLEAAACVRGPADLGLLASVVEQSTEETARRLWPALREGLIVPVAGSPTSGGDTAGLGLPSYRFAHDRIQAAVYSLRGEAERKQLHLAIGRKLRDSAGAPALFTGSERLFDTVDQLNHGVEFVVDANERAQICALNRRAADRARMSGALAPALAYARLGIDLLPKDAWQSMHDLALALHRQAIEGEFFTGDAARGESLFGTALAKAATAIHQAELCGLRASIESARGNQAGAIALGRQGLRLLDCDLDVQTPLEVKLRTLRQMLTGAPGADLAELPSMRDPVLLTATGLLSRIAVAARLTDPDLWARIVTRVVRLSLQHGRAPVTPYGYVGAGVLLASLPDDDGAGESLAQLGVQLARAERDPEIEAVTLTTFAVLSNQWCVPLPSHLPLLQRALTVALETGEFVLAGHAMNSSLSLMFHCGLELARLEAESSACGHLMRRMGPNPLQATPDVYRASILRLQSGAAPAEGTGQAPTGDARVPVHPMRLLVPVVLRQVAEIAPLLSVVAERLRNDSMIRDTFAAPWATFYVALGAALLCDQEGPDPQSELRRILADSHGKLAALGARCPDNFQHRADLVAAEIARLGGRILEALPLYDRAIVAAQRAKVIHEEALARELAGRCRLSSSLEETAGGYLSSARECYARWGALGKVAALDKEFSGAAGGMSAGTRKRPESSSDTAASEVELESLLKAAESISSEVDLDRLLERLIGVCLEVAGARRGVLILEDRKGLAVRAVGTVSEPVALDRTELGAADRVPRTLIEHVFHSGETVALADATRSVPFCTDPYILKNDVKSVLAVPIVRQTRPIGVCYLENDLASYGFAPKKVRVLTLLTSQIASALENSRLFGDLRVEVKERTRAERALRFLAESSAALAQSLDYHTTLAEVARLAVPFLADWCTVDVLETDGRKTPVAAAHRDPAKMALLHQVRRDFAKLGTPPDEDRLPFYRAHDIVAHSAITVPLIARGRALGAIMFVSETLLKRYGPAEIALAEELARRAAIAIDNARLYQEAQGAVRLREEFLAVASHELTTPIASLRLVAQSLRPGREEPSMSEVGRILGVVDRQTARLSALVGEMLDVVNLQAQGDFHPSVRLDLATEVEQIVEHMREQIRTAGCQLSLHLEPGVIGNLDRMAIGRIVANLLSNAIKFGAGKPIEITVRSQGNDGWIVVKDEGIGMDPARVPGIFERFERAVPTENYGGLGLGLYIVREIVLGLGGTVNVDSTPGSGSTFTVVLPLGTNEPAQDSDDNSILADLGAASWPG